VEEFLKQTRKIKDAEAKALQHYFQSLQEQYQAVQATRLVLRKQYQILQEQYQALQELYRMLQVLPLNSPETHQRRQDYLQSQQELQRSSQEYRRTLHDHLEIMRNHQRRLERRTEAQRPLPLIRKAILIGESDAEITAFLKVAIQQETTHRVFLAFDSTQVLQIAQNVNIDLFLLDYTLAPLSAVKLYSQLQTMQGRQALPAIILYTPLSPNIQAEIAQHRLIGLNKPIEIDALLRAIDQFFAVEI
jgi:PleD family two-component response regulator